MAFIPVPLTVMVELFFTQDAQQMENTLYFTRADTWDLTEMNALGTAINNWVTANISPLQSNTVTYRGCKITDLSSATAPAIEVLLAVGQAGANANPAMPNQTSLAIKFTTNFRGRSARGRNYIMGLCEDQVNGNFVNASVANSYVTQYLKLQDPAVIGVGPFHSVVSRFTNGAPRATGIAFDVTGVGLTDTIVDQQRRRGPGRGR